jgi:hypothetical protein
MWTDWVEAAILNGSVGLISERKSLENRFETVRGNSSLRDARFLPPAHIWQLANLAESKISECNPKFKN